MRAPGDTLSAVWHPWRTLRERSDIVVHWADLPRGLLGVTDGVSVWLARDQLQAERRCTLTHELIHIELDHHGCQPRAVERAVAIEAARRLVPIDDLCRVAVWARSTEEAAEELWVDVDTLLTRLESLTQGELDALDLVIRRRSGDA